MSFYRRGHMYLGYPPRDRTHSKKPRSQPTQTRSASVSSDQVISSTAPTRPRENPAKNVGCKKLSVFKIVGPSLMALGATTAAAGFMGFVRSRAMYWWIPAIAGVSTAVAGGMLFKTALDSHNSAAN